MIATIDGRGFDSSYVSQVDRYLDNITRSCQNRGRQHVGDLAAATKQILDEDGVNVTILQVLKAVDESLIFEDKTFPCQDFFALFGSLLSGR